ncbi:MAG: HAMP domain-containing histidine kinase [Lachnospiraceae bacterium]|nr:HAMP domain-containing histidine kinase [Lachnospiraceae bacterium]
MKLRYRLIISFIIVVAMPLLMYGTIIINGIRTGNELGIPENAPPPIVRQRVADVMISGVLIMTLTSALLIMWIYQGILRKIGILVAGAEKIKEGDLDFSVEIKGKDELSELAVTFEEMRQRLKLDAQQRLAAERNQRQLVSNIAHDLKTPLTAIRGYSEGLMDGVADTPEKRRSYVTTIHNKAEEMDVLLNELTAYSNLDTNRIPYNFKRLNIRTYFYDLSEELRLDLGNRNGELVYYNYVDEDAMFVADPVQMGRVFHNCIDNSIKYAKEDETLTLHFGIWPEGEFLHIEIKDNGIGIAPKDLPHVFERLYRGDASRTSAGGSGIGLSIVKKIVEDHGGGVEVSSRQGVGTTVSFKIKKFTPGEEKKSEQDTDRGRRRSNRRA